MTKFIELEVTGGKKLFNMAFIYKIERVDETRSRIFLSLTGENQLQLQDYVVHLSYPDLKGLLSAIELVEINGDIKTV
jgi:hypothetical protein